MFEYMQFNIAPWGHEIVIYFFLIGTAAMTFVYAAAPAVFGNIFGGVARSMVPFQKVGLIASFVLLLICGPLLIMDLGEPGRFLYPILYFHWTSPLSWGSLFLPMFGLCVVGFFYGLQTNHAGLMKFTGILGMLLALSMPLYTGLDLMVHQARGLWSNPTIPVLFVILSISSGTAMVSVIQFIRGQLDEKAIEFLHWFLFLSLASTFALFLGEWVTLLYGGSEQQQALEIINAEFGFEFWGLTFVLGIVVPLVMVALPGCCRSPALITLASVLSALGAYTFRAVLIYAGQLPQLYY